MREGTFPTLIGRVPQAQMSAHPVAMPDQYAPLARGMKDLARGAVDIASVSAAMNQEREDLEFKNEMNSAFAETQRRMQEEVFSTKGIDAEGASDKAAQILNEVAGTHKAKLSERGRMLFDAQFGAHANSWNSQAFEHQRNQLTALEAAADKQAVSDGISSYAADPNNEAALEMVTARFDDMYSRQFGRRIGAESLSAFDKDIEDGTLSRASGGSLKIVDAVTDPKTQISRTDVTRMRERMAKMAQGYETSKQQLLDQAHSQVLDNYLKFDKLGEAQAYLLKVTDKNSKYKMSPEAAKLATDVLEKKGEALTIQSEAEQGVSLATSLGGGGNAKGVGGKYGDAEQDAKFGDWVSNVRKRYSGEKRDLGERIISYGKQLYSDARNKQQADLIADATRQLGELSKMPLSQRETEISRLPEGKIRDLLLDSVEKQRNKYDSNDDPVFVDEQENQLNELKMAVHKGSIRIGDNNWPLTNSRQIAAAGQMLGLTSKRNSDAVNYLSNLDKRIDVLQVAETLKQLSGDKDINPISALKRYPSIIKDLELRLGPGNEVPKSNRETWYKANISDLLLNKQTEKGWMWDSNRSGTDVLKNGYDQARLYRTSEQMEEAFRREMEYRSLSSPSKLVKARSAVIDTIQLRRFASEHGFTYDEKLKRFKQGE